MNFKTAIILGWVSTLLAVVGSIWGVVQFILYLVKNIPFMWWFLIPLGISLALVILGFFFTVKNPQVNEASKLLDDAFGGRSRLFRDGQKGGRLYRDKK